MSDEPTTAEETGEETPKTERASRRGKKGGGAGGNGEPPRRELEEAPRLLKKSSLILTYGAILPWMTTISTKGHMPWAMWAIGVALTAAAGWLLYDGANARAGAKANGISKALANANPMAATGASLALFVGALVVAFSAKVIFNGGEFVGFAIPEGADGEALSNTYSLRAALEHATLYLALATFAHIHNYEYGGKFNPIFPLMFLGPAVAGSLHTLTAAKAAFGSDSSPVMYLGVIGSIVVAAGGIMAMYTMYVTMKVAKEEGDKKKAEERERRRVERASRRES